MFSHTLSLQLLKMIAAILFATVALAAAAPADQPPVAILAYSNEPNPDGSYAWSYETENGIKAEERGVLGQGEEGPVVNAQGGFSYTGNDGVPIKLTYVADGEGFKPVGDHLPTSPPIPAAIQRALDYIRSLPPQQDGPAKKG